MVERKVERKSMTDALALDRQRLSFIRSGDKSPAEPQVDAEGDETTVAAGMPAARSESRPVAGNDITQSDPTPRRNESGEPIRGRKSRPRTAHRDFADTLGEPAPVLVPLTTRITQATAESLRRVSLELRLQRRKYAQQDIVEAALRSWLETHGFDG
jgi:hypothetical protein